MTCLQFYAKRELVGTSVAVLGNRTFRAYHAGRRRCIGVLIMSENQVKNVSHLSVNRRRRSSENTELNFRTVPRERNIWSKFSAGRKFVRRRVNVALIFEYY